MYDLLIENCDILHCKQGRFWVDLKQNIAISGQRISRIQSAGSGAPLAALQSINAPGLLAIPGLMNTHAHVPMVLFRGMVEDVSVATWFNDYIWPMEVNLTPEDVYWGALLGCAEMIAAGVTSVADHYFSMDQVARAVSESGIRANLAWAAFGHEGIAKLDQTSQFVADWHGKADGRISAWLGPHAPYTTGQEYLKLAARRALEVGTGVHIHVSETSAQVAQSLAEHGITPVRMLEDTGILEAPTILAHCAFPTDADLAILARRSTGIAHSPKTYLKLGSGVVRLERFRQRNIPVGTATDGAASSNSLDILEQLRLLALAQKHISSDPVEMPVANVLEIAFEGSARVLHMADDLGSIEPGKLADIALLRQDGLHLAPRYNPAATLIYSARASDVDTVICNGKVLLRNRELQTLDKDEIKKQVNSRIERLSQRVPGTRVAFYPA